MVTRKGVEGTAEKLREQLRTLEMERILKMEAERMPSWWVQLSKQLPPPRSRRGRRNQDLMIDLIRHRMVEACEAAIVNEGKRHDKYEAAVKALAGLAKQPAKLCAEEGKNVFCGLSVLAGASRIKQSYLAIRKLDIPKDTPPLNWLLFGLPIFRYMSFNAVKMVDGLIDPKISLLLPPA
jgi:hypothetical protein